MPGLERLAPARISPALVPHMITSAALAAENAAGAPIASAIGGRQSDGREGLRRPDFAVIGRDGRHVTEFSSPSC